ncbi:ubiquitin carboxyl-terminal hydrolase BAP1-like isoform X2 [Ruditapes philippinarum]|uniref:ubiquitin carboxyl-terminal hydrolase BAP1-like isoform X2 n=1 Tax=Ruditapes philippinarum TaxID=129788 RepID=UPI00295BDF0E|nr:ubiquitin carboxyl-terminal hydrolase BAP1-like isoform X2 [Ruditapes philippinarum]
MNKGWLELESDPGLFTLLLQDFGVKGVQVEEIYDLQKAFEGTTYGFIFLFRWIEERRSRRKTITEDESFVTDDNIVNSIFFAQQMIPNSCATHALLSVLLNCEKVNLGQTLSELKSYSKHMNPENKGYAIGNIPELARAHNSHARRENSHLPEKQQGMTIRTMEAFHFVSYVPIHGHLFELDGLKPYPIDHGPWESNEDWTEKFRRVISERLGMATGGEPYHDIRFNLMAVVPDKVSLYEHKLSTLKTNRQIVLEALQQMVKVTNPNITTAEKEKCLAVVKKHGPVNVNIAVPMEIDEPDLTKRDLESGSREMTTAVKSEVIDLTDDDLRTTTTTTTEEVIKTGLINDISRVKLESEIKTELTLKSDVGNKNVTNCARGDVQTSVNEGMEVQISVASDADGVSTIVPTTAATTDVTKPLTIETKFSASPGPSSESTDTASEVGSCFSSPSSSTMSTSAQNSPNVAGGERITDGGKEAESSSPVKSKTKFNSQQGFRPKDLIALLKNVENEIKLCETKLQDEEEKIKKYKIDNCRRTHNYDQFLCTFLSMLAEQGHLAELVQQHSFIKKRVPGHIGSKLSKLSQAAKKKQTKAKRRR